MSAQPALVSAAEYLALEEEALDKHEFVDGRIYAMAGCGANHLRITAELNGILHEAFRGGPCEYLPSDTKVAVRGGSAYYYPDACVACPPRFVDVPKGMIDNPTAIFEVLSESTAALDEGAKFIDYRQLAALKDYVLIDSRKVLVKVLSLEGGQWMVRQFEGLEEMAGVPSISLQLPLETLYARVDFAVNDHR